MAGSDQRSQRHRGDLRGAEVNEIHRSAESKATRTRFAVTLAGGDPPVLSHRLATLFVAHPVEHEHAVQVIELVLVHPRLEVIGFVLDDLAVDIDPAEQDGARSNQLDVQPWNGETALVVHPLPGGFDDFRVEDGPPVPVEIPDDHLLLHSDLRGGESDTPVAVVEGVEHLLDESDRPAVNVDDRGCLRLEHRVAEGSDLEAHRWQATEAMAHYFDEEPDAPSDPRRIDVTAGSISFSLDTDAGVFSHGRLDTATALLLNTSPPPPTTGDLLDLGCGSGPIALVMAHQSPGATVWAVDVNRRARNLTASNAKRLGLDNVRVCAPDEVPSQLRFAAIRSNPPIRIGKEEMRSLLASWLDRLEVEALAHLVVSRHLGADSLSSWLIERGHPVDRVTSRRGFRVLSVGDRRAP